MEVEKECSHHWNIESPNGPWSLAVCKKCNKRDAFKNSVEDSGWTNSPSKAQLLNGDAKKLQIQSKEEFLLSKKLLQRYPIINTTKYESRFVDAAVAEALKHGRSAARKKYGLPESTLRRWVTRYKQSNNIKEKKAS